MNWSASGAVGTVQERRHVAQHDLAGTAVGGDHREAKRQIDGGREVEREDARTGGRTAEDERPGLECGCARGRHVVSVIDDDVLGDTSLCERGAKLLDDGRRRRGDPNALVGRHSGSVPWWGSTACGSSLTHGIPIRTRWTRALSRSR